MENKISTLRDALEYEIRLIVNADNMVELTFDATLAMKKFETSYPA